MFNYSTFQIKFVLLKDLILNQNSENFILLNDIETNS